MPEPAFLDGEEVTLRPTDREDIPFIQRAMNDPAVWRPALDIDPMTYDQAEEFYEDVLVGGDGVHCMVYVDDDPVGHVSLAPSQYGPDETSRARSVELAYWIVPAHQGQGYGSDAVERVVRYAFEDRNLRRLSARVGSFNESSVRLLESVGFEHEGTLRQAAWFRGDYHDMLWYGLLRTDWE